ncbi:ABC transporter transmembrane domain-containing protein, partial [Magnetococcales bacterium HHB-1]
MSSSAIALDSRPEPLKIGSFQAQSPFAHALIPLLDALGWRGDHVRLLEALPHMASEMTLADFLNTLANLKFESRSFTMRLDRIEPRTYPCLFVDSDGEVWVLVQGEGDKILAFHGDSQRYEQRSADATLGTAVFFKQMTSEAIQLLKPGQNWFFLVLNRFRHLFVVGLLSSLLLSLLALVSPMLVMTIYDQILASRSQETLLYFSGGVLLFLVGDMGFKLLRGQLFSFISVRLGNIVGNEVFRRILYLPPSHTESAPLGAQISRIRDFENVRTFF